MSDNTHFTRFRYLFLRLSFRAYFFLLVKPSTPLTLLSTTSPDSVNALKCFHASEFVENILISEMKSTKCETIVFICILNIFHVLSNVNCDCHELCSIEHCANVNVNLFWIHRKVKMDTSSYSPLVSSAAVTSSSSVHKIRSKIILVRIM